MDRNIKVQLHNFLSNLDRRSSHEVFLKAFSIRGDPRYLDGRDPL
jgi:hypothetical protein